MKIPGARFPKPDVLQEGMSYEVAQGAAPDRSSLFKRIRRNFPSARVQNLSQDGGYGLDEDNQIHQKVTLSGVSGIQTHHLAMSQVVLPGNLPEAGHSREGMKPLALPE